MTYTKPFRVGNLTNGPIILGHIDAPITLAGCEPDITLSAQPPVQEDKMTDNPTAATIRAAHSNMEAIIAAVIRDQIRIFERKTGLEVHGVEVQLATLTSPSGRETLVESVDVRVGLGR